jgi:hypothetical protein
MNQNPILNQNPISETEYPKMEDTPDKVRRNVVTLSAGIVLFWFLDLQLSNGINFFGIAPLRQVSPFKLWICATVALIYMFLRYRFDKGAAAQFLQVREDSQAVLRKFLEPRVNRKLMSVISSEKPVESDGNIRLFYESEPLELVLPNRWRSTGTSPHMQTAILMPSIWRKRVQVQVSGDFTWTVGAGTSSIFLCEAEIPIHHYVGLLCWTPLRVLLYSKSSVDVIVPFVLAGAALLVCLSKLAPLI